MYILTSLTCPLKISQQTQRRLFEVEKTSSQVAWKTPFFRPVLEDFSGLKKGACKSSLRPQYWDANMIKKYNA